MQFNDVLSINPYCQILDHHEQKAFNTYIYSIHGFIDLDGSCGINGAFSFRMKNKSFNITFSSSRKIDIKDFATIRLKDLYERKF